MRTEKAQLKADLPKMHKTTEGPASSFSMSLHRNLDLLPVFAGILVHFARILLLGCTHVQVGKQKKRDAHFSPFLLFICSRIIKKGEGRGSKMYNKNVTIKL
jgi:hypothetical protein